jgi:glycosyltransferase involved in cell wall biosynthesis
LRNSRNIALDATYSIGDAPSGVGLYSREILNGLAVAHPEQGFDFCYRPHRYLRARNAGAPSNRAPSNIRRRVLLDPFWPRGVELFHGLNQRLPRIGMQRAVATFHDLFVMTGEYSTPEFRARFTAQARDAAARADRVIAVSEFTKGQVVSLLGVDPARVQVVYHGTRQFAVPGGTPAEREKVILNVGAIQKRKNIVRLVEAFETLDAGWRLVLAGAQGYGAAGILARIEASGARDRIHVPGYVTEDELAGWYARAAIFAFPSLDEGFGMPLLEAMAAGVPVITSNRSALAEVAGNAALLVDPENRDTLGEGLRELARNGDLCRELVRRGSARAKLFTWEKAAQETWDVYQTLLR